MKKLSLYVLASGLAFLLAAFTKQKKNFFGNIYYGVYDPFWGVHWTNVHPNPTMYHCEIDAPAYCTIVTHGLRIYDGQIPMPGSVWVVREGLYLPN